MILREKLQVPLKEKFVKVAVDIKRNILSYGCELHLDCADELANDGSAREHLWGANVYPLSGKIDFVSLINIRPQDGNRAMEIALPEIKEKVAHVITALLFP